MERVAVQVILYKGSKYLPMLLRSLREQTTTDWKLYVCENTVDPAEAASAQRLLEESGIAHHLYIAPENLGFAGGHNALYRLHDAEFMLALNQDAYLEPEYIEACIKRFDAGLACASVSGLIYRWTVDPSVREALTDVTPIDTAGLEYHCLADIVDRFAGVARGAVKDRIAHAQEVFGVSGAIAMYRRSSVIVTLPEQLPFDPSFFMYKEDVDLAIRLRRKGFTAWFEPAAIAFHERGLKASGSGLMDRIREERERPERLRIMSYRNQWMVYVYHWSFALGFGDIAHTKLHEIRRGMLVLLASPIVFFSAWWKIVTSLPAAFKRRAEFRRLGLRNIKLA
ncbi:MAG: glycosyltransferase [Patescibacteria group bacterium]